MRVVANNKAGKTGRPRGIPNNIPPPAAIEDGRMYTYAEAGAILRMTPDSVRHLTADGKLGFIFTGRQRGRRISSDHLREFMSRRDVPRSAA